ncbi:MAG: 30S ribosomal protein S18 [Caldilineae bacterium]|nr:30S ribosomal protein S18 [Chloroflexota bacterium]MCB9176844.1 30S ribosomal protein S18 [Caldilineae bacterium]
MYRGRRSGPGSSDGPRGRGASVPKDPKEINFKNVDLLERFLDDGGRIRSRRRTRIDAKNQRRITRAVKHARYMALLPYTHDHVRLFGGRS